jgi:uncharacterized RDD family membrane protein YckC
LSLYASPKSRILAKLIDLTFVVLIGLVIRGGVGSVLGFAYSILADGLPGKTFAGQSLGKKVMQIRVLFKGDAPAWKSSVIRNSPIGLVTFLMIIPFWGWILSVVVGVPLAAYELSLIFRADKRQRLGDQMADTVVLGPSPS